MSINAAKRFTITQHMKSAKHQRALDSNEHIPSPSHLREGPSATNSGNSFSLDLCKAFVDADIPLWKLENASLRSFLEKYTKQQIPHESTIRKQYVDKYYQQVMSKIRETFTESKIWVSWVSIDETTDANGRQIAHVIAGSMNPGQPSAIFLIDREQLTATNSSTITQLVIASLAQLWPEGVHFDDVLLLVTDAALYMKKAARALELVFPNLTHLTCLAHALHRVAEHVRSLFPDVDKLISNGKKIFLKSPFRCGVLLQYRFLHNQSSRGGVHGLKQRVITQQTIKYLEMLLKLLTVTTPPQLSW